jgi:hypothetical protein
MKLSKFVAAAGLSLSLGAFSPMAFAQAGEQAAAASLRVAACRQQAVSARTLRAVPRARISQEPKRPRAGLL